MAAGAPHTELAGLLTKKIRLTQAFEEHVLGCVPAGGLQQSPEALLMKRCKHVAQERNLHLADPDATPQHASATFCTTAALRHRGRCAGAARSPIGCWPGPPQAAKQACQGQAPPRLMWHGHRGLLGFRVGSQLTARNSDLEEWEVLAAFEAQHFDAALVSRQAVLAAIPRALASV